MFLIILFLSFFVFRPTVWAQTTTPTLTPTSTAPNATVSFDSGATETTKGKQFDVNVKVTNVLPSTTYHVRVYGGIAATDCAVDVLYNSDSWTNGCNTYVNSMPSITTGSSDTNFTITMRLRASPSGSSGTYLLFANVSELNLNSSSRTITVIDGPTATNTPYPTSTPTITPTPKPTSILTPTPRETIAPLTPVMEPTVADIPTVAITTDEVTPTATDLINPSDESEPSSFLGYLPIIFIVLGLGLFAVPVLGPKISAWVKSKKGKPPIVPPTIIEPPINPVN